ncbi:MAG: copper-binding protein [Anaerolineae bacterium]|nr:copper-binding protein [Anaerolineae bacterium]
MTKTRWIGIFAAMAAALAGGPAAGSNAGPGADTMAAAEVRRVDRERNRITLRHGEIKALDMPPMTMVFEVRDPKLLDGVKAGDKVRFRAVKEPNGAYVVTVLEPSP